MNRRSILISIPLALASATSAFAAKARSSKAELVAGATHIVVGRVLSISENRVEEEYRVTTHYAAIILIANVEKGADLTIGSTLLAKYAHWGPRAGQRPTPGAADGHSPTPQIGDDVRVYLVDRGYAGGTGSDGPGYNVYFKNGFELMAK